MSFTTEILSEVDEKDWNQRLLHTKWSTAFQIASIYKPHQNAFNSKPIFIMVKDQTGEIVGQLSAVIHVKDYWTDSNLISRSLISKLNLGSILLWHHGPIIHDPANQNEIISNILTKIDEIAKKNNVLMIKGSFPPLSKHPPNNIFRRFGYTHQRWITHITDLNHTVEKLYYSLHNKTRYDIRKGEKNELLFELAKDKSNLNEYIELKFQGTKRKDEIIKRNEKLANSLWEILYKKGYEKLFLVRYKGEFVGGIVNMIFNKNVVEHSVANSPRKELYGGSFLTWNTIKWSVERNYSRYDMGGANPSPSSNKEKGILFFKSKWSGKELDYDLYTKVLNKAKMKISRALSQPSLISKKMRKLIR